MSNYHTLEPKSPKNGGVKSMFSIKPLQPRTYSDHTCVWSLVTSLVISSSVIHLTDFLVLLQADNPKLRFTAPT